MLLSLILWDRENQQHSKRPGDNGNGGEANREQDNAGCEIARLGTSTSVYTPAEDGDSGDASGDQCASPLDPDDGTPPTSCLDKRDGDGVTATPPTGGTCTGSRAAGSNLNRKEHARSIGDSGDSGDRGVGSGGGSDERQGRRSLRSSRKREAVVPSLLASSGSTAKIGATKRRRQAVVTNTSSATVNTTATVNGDAGCNPAEGRSTRFEGGGATAPAAAACATVVSGRKHDPADGSPPLHSTRSSVRSRFPTEGDVDLICINSTSSSTGGSSSSESDFVPDGLRGAGGSEVSANLLWASVPL